MWKCCEINLLLTYLVTWLLKVTSFTFPLLQVSRQSRDVVTVGLLKRKRQKASSNSSKFSKSYLLTFLGSFSKTLVEQHNVVTLGKYPKCEFFKHTLLRATSEWTGCFGCRQQHDIHQIFDNFPVHFEFIFNSNNSLTTETMIQNQ